MKIFYLENKERGPRGNKVLWWARNNAGYTCDICEAKEFTEAEADKILSTSSAKYSKHEVEYIKRVATPYVDPQHLTNKTQHTPGPWKVCEYSWSDAGIYPNNENAWPICKLSIYDQATEENQTTIASVMNANARLIAAAPELLEALKDAAMCFSAHAICNKTAKHIESLIAKAQGE